MGYEAMVYNERGLFDEALRVFSENDVVLEELVSGLKEKHREQILASRTRSALAVQDEWHGASKLEAMTLTKKMMRGERDHRGRSTRDWSDEVPDK